MRRWRRLLPFVRPYRPQMLGVLVFTIGTTGASLLAPWLVRELIQVIESGEGGISAVAWISFGLLGALLLQGAFQFLSYWIAHVLAWWLCHDLRMALYDHLQQLSLSFYSRRQTGELQSRVLKDTENMEPLIADVIPEAIANALLFFGVAVILFLLNPGLAALTLIPVPLLILAIWFIGKKVYKAFESELERLGALSAAVQDNLSGIKEIQIFTRERRERLGALSARYAADQVRARKLDGALQPTVLFSPASERLSWRFSGGGPPLLERFRSRTWWRLSCT